MPKALIHIGTHKTGTSSLQHWLSTHNSLLARHGIRYFEQLAFAKGDRKNRLFAEMARTEGPLQELQSWGRFARALTETDGNVVLSSEHWSAKLNHHPAERMSAFFEDRGYEVEFILYLRDLPSFVSSLYSQLVKRMRFASRFQVYGRRYGVQEHPTYGQIISAYDLGRPLHVRPFPPRAGDLSTDFLPLIGVPGEALAETTAELPQLNLRPTNLEVLSARMAKTKWIAAGRPGGLQEMSKCFAALMTEHRDNGTLRGEAFSPFGPRGAAAFTDKHLDDLNPIAERFFGQSWTEAIPPVAMARTELEPEDLAGRAPEDQAFVEHLVEETFAAHHVPAPKRWINVLRRA